MSSVNTYTFYVSGMHCRSCVLMTEQSLLEIDYVHEAKTSLEQSVVVVKGDFSDKNVDDIIRDFNNVLSLHGYTVSVKKPISRINWSEFYLAIPTALGVLLFLVFLNKIGVTNLVNTAEIGYGTALAMGLVASISTCMSVVGGVVMSVSATFARDGDRIVPQMLFHIGRLTSFFLLGGLLALIGGIISVTPTVSLLLTLIVGVVMFILGINLLDIIPWTRRLQLPTPKFFSQHALALRRTNHTITPFLLGVVTFFLPCGFTQSMQIFVLTMGDFLRGGLMMLMFAIGTLPVLAVISFSSLAITRNNKSGVFFKTVGLIVIAFSIFNIFSSSSLIIWYILR